MRAVGRLSGSFIGTMYDTSIVWAEYDWITGHVVTGHQAEC